MNFRNTDDATQAPDPQNPNDEFNFANYDQEGKYL